MIDQRHSYMPTRKNGFVLNTNGAVYIIPKPSAIVIYSPVTRYTSHGDGQSGKEWDLTGSQLMKDQAGYDCLIICNAMNGFYMQIGVWERDPYTRHLKDYKPPRYNKPPLPWARSLTTGAASLVPVEICCTAAEIPTAFAGRSVDGHEPIYETAEQHTRASMVQCPIWGLINVPVAGVSGYAQKEPSLFLGLSKYTNTCTYATNIGVKFYGFNGINEKSIAYDCPPPYNQIRYTEFKDENVFHAYSYTSDSCVQINSVADLPFETKKINDNKMVIFDTELVYDQRAYVNRVKPLLWDKPAVLLNTKAAATGARDRTIQPVAVIPLMLYHEGWKDKDGRLNGVIDGRTGRRTARGKTIVTFITNTSITQFYNRNTQTQAVMHQVSRAITKHPIYDVKSLKKILNPNTKERS